MKGLLPGQQLVQLPGGKLHVLHTQQTYGVTSTSLAGNAVLKKVSDGTTVDQQQQPSQQHIVIATAAAAPDQQQQQVVFATQQVGSVENTNRTVMPVTKVQMTPTVGVKPGQVSVHSEGCVEKIGERMVVEFVCFTLKVEVKIVLNHHFFCL